MGQISPLLNLATGGYNLTPSSMRKFRTAMAKATAGGNNAKIMVYGDSISSGSGATDTLNGGWVNRLASRIGVGRGLGFYAPRGDHAGFSGDLSTGTVVRFNGSLGGSWGPLANCGPLGSLSGGGALFGPGAATPPSVTIGPNVAASRVIFYLQRTTLASGFGRMVCTFTVDGSTALTFDTGSASTNRIDAVAVDMAQGAHTVVMTGSTAGSDAVILHAVEVVSGGNTGGVRVGRIALSGIQASVFLDSGGVTGFNGVLATEFDMYAPDLSIIMLETNDSNVGTQTALATYKANIQTLISRARLTGDVLLLTTVPQTPVPTPLTLAQYTQQLYQLADANNVGLLDLAARWADHTTSSSLFADGFHPNDGGHQDIANAVYTALASCGVGI